MKMEDKMEQEFIKSVGELFVLGFLCYAQSQARRVCNDIANNANKLDIDGMKRVLVVYKTVFNFYLITTLIIVICVRYLGFIQNNSFIPILFGTLAALGIKLVFDISGETIPHLFKRIIEIIIKK